MGSEYKLLNTFEFIKAVSGTVFDMINAVYHDMPLIFYRGYVSGEANLPSSGSEYKLLSTFKFIKAVSGTVFDMMNAVYHGNPFIFLSRLPFGTSSTSKIDYFIFQFISKPCCRANQNSSLGILAQSSHQIVCSCSEYSTCSSVDNYCTYVRSGGHIKVLFGGRKHALDQQGQIL